MLDAENDSLTHFSFCEGNFICALSMTPTEYYSWLQVI